jgi:peptidyl-prolyl cis-trans isomerase A (cyclophilin A)
MLQLALATWLTVVPVQSATAANLLDTEQKDRAPASFKARFETTAGDFVVKVERAWSPAGVDRLHDLVARGYYDHVAIYRVIHGFVAQFGIHGNPQIASKWRMAHIPDDQVLASNKKKTLTFAMAGPNTRTTQLFINLKNNRPLDTMGFAPVGKVVSGWRAVKALYSGYGEGAPKGYGPDQIRLRDEGNEYLKARFPDLDYIVSATVL